MKKINTKFFALLLILLIFYSSITAAEIPQNSRDSNVGAQPANPKFDAYLSNSTYLAQEGYLNNGLVRVIAKTADNPNQLQTMGCTVVKEFPELSMLVLDATPASLQAFATQNQVTGVYLDREIHCLDSSSLPVIKPPAEWSNITSQYGKLDGAGIKIAILDTGIDPNHPDFKFANGTSKITASKDFTNSGSTYDEHGHGTHCASIAAGTGAASNGLYAGVAPNATLIIAKVMKSDGTGTDSTAIDGIQWAISQGADVISMSFGTCLLDTSGSDALSQAVDWATNSGVVCCAAAGNNGGNYGTINSPACAKTAIAVGACDNNRQVYSASSRGPTSDYRIKPDISAPGVNIIAARANGSSLGMPVGSYYMTLTGTSMACPHVSGSAALIMQAHPNWTAQQIKTALVESAKPPQTGSADDLFTFGGGITDVANAISVTTFASTSSVSFFQSVYNPTAFNRTLGFTPQNVSVTFQPSRCESTLPIPLAYSSGNIVFSCPANTTATWTARLNADDSSTFTGHVSIPVAAFTYYSAPTTNAWYPMKTVTTAASWPRIMATYNDRLYVADAYYTGWILEYSLPTLTLLRSLQVTERMISAITIQNGYVYTGSVYGYIYKISLDTFKVEAQTEMPNNAGITKLIAYNNKLYATTHNGTLCKFNAFNLALQSSLKLDKDIQTGIIEDGYLYFLTAAGNLWKLNPETLTGPKISLDTNGFGLNSLVAANGYLYAVANTGLDFYVKIMKISEDLSTIQFNSIKMPKGYSYTLAYSNNELYVATHSTDVTTSTELASFIRIDPEKLLAEYILNNTITIKLIPGGFSDQPFLSSYETIVAWSNYLIASYDSGTLLLTRDDSQNGSIPTCVSDDVSSTRAGYPSSISTTWTSSQGLSGFIFGSNNSGCWKNDTWQPLLYNYAKATTTFTVNASNSAVAWKVWCNDTNNHWSETDNESFNVTPSEYYTLAVLPSDYLQTNPRAGNYSYPAGTSVTLKVLQKTVYDYKFKDWVIDSSTKQATDTVTVVMNKDYTVQAEAVFTSETVTWEHFTPVRVSATFTMLQSYEWACSPYYAQTFTVGNTPHTVNTIRFFLGVIGKPPGNLTVSIRATQNGVPTGPDLCKGTIDLSTLKSAAPGMLGNRDWIVMPVTYPTSPITLKANTQYALITYHPNGVSSDSVGAGVQNMITQYTGGALYRLKSDGVTWQHVEDADELWQQMNMVFQIMGQTTRSDPNPTPTSTAIPTPTPTPSPSPTLTPTPTPTPTPKPTATPTPSPTPTVTPIPTPTATPSPTPTPTTQPTPTPTETPTPTPNPQTTNPTPVTTISAAPTPTQTQNPKTPTPPPEPTATLSPTPNQSLSPSGTSSSSTDIDPSFWTGLIVGVLVTVFVLVGVLVWIRKIQK